MFRFRLCVFGSKITEILCIYPSSTSCQVTWDCDLSYCRWCALWSFEELSAQFFHHKVTLFPFMISQYFVGSYFKRCKYLVLHQTFQCIYFSICWSVYHSISMDPCFLMFKVHLFLWAWAHGFTVSVIIDVNAQPSWWSPWKPLCPASILLTCTHPSWTLPYWDNKVF